MIDLELNSLQKILNGDMEIMELEESINSYNNFPEATLDLIFEAEEFEEILKQALKRNKKFISKQKKLLKDKYGQVYENGVLTFQTTGVNCTQNAVKEVLKNGEVLSLGEVIGKQLNRMVAKNNNK